MGQEHSRGKGSTPGLAALDADVGRNRVFYSREVGLVTPWYLAQRCEEKCCRVERYGRPFRLLVVEPLSWLNKAVVQGQIAQWLHRGLRKSDIPAYLGGGCYAILLPETDEEEAARFAARLKRDVQTVEIAVASYPQDGQTVADLLAAARGILHNRDLVA